MGRKPHQLLIAPNGLVANFVLRGVFRLALLRLSVLVKSRQGRSRSHEFSGGEQKPLSASLVTCTLPQIIFSQNIERYISHLKFIFFRFSLDKFDL